MFKKYLGPQKTVSATLLTLTVLIRCNCNIKPQMHKKIMDNIYNTLICLLHFK